MDLLNMNKYNFMLYAVLVCIMASCTITGRISRRQTKAEIEHSTRLQRECLDGKGSRIVSGAGSATATRSKSRSKKRLGAGMTIGAGSEERLSTGAATGTSTAERSGSEMEPNSGSEVHRGYIEYTRADNSKFYIAPAVTTPDGETMMQLTIPEVVVAAQARSIPERNGKVSLDFVVTLPKKLMGNCRSVEVTPVLHKRDGYGNEAGDWNGADTPLGGLTIRGALFDKVQERNYWQYDRYLDMFNPDAVGRQRAYERFISYPYPEGTRLDSVVSNRTTISYFYTQEVPTADTEGNRLLITLDGRVSALDHSEYRFPLSDTLAYNISSMLSFVDTTTRYVTRVIEKYAVVKDRNYLNFEVDRSDIVDTLGDNKAQLSRIEGLMDAILNQRVFYIDSIILTASASPEGSVMRNERLARDRAHSLRERLAAKFRLAGIDSLVTVRWLGEDWEELGRLICEDDNNGHLRNREAILEMIAASGRLDKDGDDLEQEIRERFPDDYRYMSTALYPRLRAVSFKYNLRRVGMLKGTIHTTVPDTIYARGVKLLKSRKYREALKVLGGFYDRNAAICMLSLGMDAQAYNTLKNLPENSTHCYLLSIACVRLGREDEALRHFNRAVELNDNLRYRGALDPEMSKLIDKTE